jgi:3-hydroxyisobutyrate dehydrogenase-like beta-hydroxyacid dehydrogenase
MDVGFIGLGNMGQSMARNLCNAGHSVTVYNRTRSRAEELKAHGAIVVDTPADASRGDAVITMLADDRAVEEVVLGESGFFCSHDKRTYLHEHYKRGALSILLTRIEVGRTYVAAPVFGRPMRQRPRSCLS